jgi:hypothetical protein
MLPNPGCEDIFGRRSRTSPVGVVVEVDGVRRAVEGRKVAGCGRIVGRRERKDVNVLRVVSPEVVRRMRWYGTASLRIREDVPFR